MGFWSQLCLLIGKHITLRKRQPVTLLVELIWPILLLLTVSFIKQAAKPGFKGPCYYKPINLPNGDLISFTRSFVCSVDYKCYDYSRIKEASVENNLKPLFDVITSEKVYAKLVEILPVLKSSLKDVNNLQNNPFFSKIENGTITLTDFLNDTELFKRKLVDYGLTSSTSSTFLNSEIRILEIYKELKFSDKLKEKDLCDPLQLIKYLISNSTNVYSKPNDNEILSKNSSYINKNDYEISKMICGLSKRKVLSDADFLFKEINMDIIANYTNSIVGFFENSRLSKTIEYLTKYLAAGKDFSKDLSMFEKFSNIEELVKVIENSFKLIDILKKYDGSLRFLKQVMGDFSPIFSTIKRWNQFEALVHLIIGVNDMMGKLENKFTVAPVFDKSLLSVYETNFQVKISNSFDFQTANLDFNKLIELLLKLKFTNPHTAICDLPKIGSLFKNGNYSWTSASSLNSYCSKDIAPYTQSIQIANYLFENINFKYLFQTLTNQFLSSDTNFMELFKKLEDFELKEINLGSANDLTLIFGLIRTAIDFLQDGLSDKGVLNTRNIYELAKKLIKGFIPGVMNEQIWTYLDIFLPTFLPVLDTKNQFLPVTPKADTTSTKKPTVSIKKIFDVTSVGYEINPTADKLDEQTTDNFYNPITNVYNDYTIPSVIDNTIIPDDISYQDQTAKIMYDDSPLRQTEETANIISYQDLETYTTDDSEVKNATYLAPRILKNKRAFDITSLAALGGLASLGLGGGIDLNSPQGILSLTGNLLPLLNLLPLDSLIPGSDGKDTTAIISSIPLIISLANSITNFKPDPNNPAQALSQWKNLINDFKSKSVDLVKILTQAGRIKQTDSIIIMSILESADLDELTNPNVVGQVSLACKAVNIWSLIQPDQSLKKSIKSISLLMDLSDDVLKTILLLVSNNNVTFNCTNDPFKDYYTLTKNLNLLGIAAKLKELILNENSNELMLFMDCSKIDKIYQSSLKVQQQLDFDTSNILKTKLKCFEESILNPLNSLYTGSTSFLDTAGSNAETISLVAGNLNKIIELVKLISWANKIFQVESSSSTSIVSNSILDNATQINFLISELPSLMKDVNEIRKSFVSLSVIQNNINFTSINDLNNENVIFSLIDTIKSFKSDINLASLKISEFLKKYDSIVKMTTYSEVLSDIDNGIQSLAELVNFFSENINGIPVNILFSDFGKIENYLQEIHGLTSENTAALGISRIYESPQKIFHTYNDMRKTICSDKELEYFLTNKSLSFVTIHDKNNNIWLETSKFLCSINARKFTDLSSSFASDFILPTNIKDIFLNDTSNLMNLSKNNTLFNSLLDDSIITTLNSTSLQSVRRVIEDLNEINYKYRALGFQNVVGKALCGNEFFFQIEDYGFSVKSGSDDNNFIFLDEHDSRFNLSKNGKEIPFQKSEYCTNITSKIQELGGPVIEKILKPILLGKILYTPKTNATYQIIKKINSTFEQFDQLVNVLLTFSNGLNHFDDLRELTENISKLFENQFYQDFIQLFLLQQTQINFEDLRSFIIALNNITSYSDNWKKLSSLLKTASRMIGCFEIDRFVPLDNENELEEVAAKLFANGTFLAGIVFENVKYSDRKLSDNIKVKIRMNIDNVPETNLIRPWLWTSNPSDNLFMDLRYLRGFIQIQNLFERALIETIQEMKGTSVNITKVEKLPIPVPYLQQFPYPRYKLEDATASYVNYFILPILVTLMWSGNIGLAIRNLVKEKEKFIEETMKAMGLRSGINWLAWFISTYAVMLVVSLIVSLILKYGGIFPIADLSITFVSLAVFAFSGVMLSFFVGSFFSKTNLASLIGVLVYFISYLPFILVMSLKYEISYASKFALCLSSATAFGYSSLYISWYEQQEKGLNWSRVWESPIPGDDMSFALAILIMTLDGIIYGILGWYVKNVFPSRYGATKPWYFVFAPKFWKQTLSFLICDDRKKSTDEYLKDRSFRGDRKGAKSKDKYTESEPFHLPVGISLKGLSRKFNDKTVVDNLSLNFFEGQITALLGHNGAGKSTTINVLTGIYTPSSGTAYIYNRDVRYEYNQIRKHVGICPQHDVLFEYMTVKEHLLFYGKLKENMGSKELKRDINDMILKMGLNPYANDLVSCLSGGVRRRLEVAIAFVAGSKTVILDEPTNGVDPYNRMKIWDIILEFRVGRTILLTTHYLEEADILSDRIAIIHQGKLQCCGSSMFLKNRFGNGYILSVDLKKDSNLNSTPLNMNSKQLLQQSNLKVIDSLTQFISKRIQGVNMNRSVNGQLSYILAYNQKPKFQDFFTSFDQNKEMLGVESYGISDTTLEEIFLFLTTRDENGDLVSPSLGMKLADAVSTEPGLPTNIHTISFESDKDSGVAVESASQDALSTKSGSPNHHNSNIKNEINMKKGHMNDGGHFSSASSTHTRDTFTTSPSSIKYQGRDLLKQQFIGLILQRLHHYRRNMRVLLTNVFLPCLFVALSMGFTLIRPKLTKQISLEMSPEIYEPNQIFMSFDKTNDTYLQAMKTEFLKTFNATCPSNQASIVNQRIPFANQQQVNFLCNLISYGTCELVYQFSYNNVFSEQTIKDSLSIYLDSQNCTVEQVLLETHNNNINDRYGGYSYADHYIRDDMFEENSKLVVWFQNQAFHAMPSFLHNFYAMYLQCLNNGVNTKNCNLIEGLSKTKQVDHQSYQIFNHPISLNDDRISYDTMIQKIADIGISLTILCAYAFVPAGFIVYVVRERISQEKRLKYVCGVKPYLYWISAFVWDFAYYLVIIGLTLAVIACFGSSAYTASARNFGALVLLLVLFGWSTLPMSYMLGNFFKDSGTAYLIIFCFTLFSGIATCVTVFLLSFMGDANKSVKITYQFLSKFCLLFPSYNLGSGLIELTKNQIIADTYAKFGIKDKLKDPFEMDMLGYKFLALALTGILFFAIVMLIEYSSNIKIFKPQIESMVPSHLEDHDVSQERQRIQNNEARSDIVVVKNLTKRFRKATGTRVCATNNLCFSIPWGHCFGLLGINGAGKTTTFKMITGEITPTFGTKLFNGMTMREFLKNNIIGYCPQFDAVDEYLTGREALYCYAKLIGLKDIQSAVLAAINRFKLQSFINIPILKYSGGMKRTLSVAVAMLGNPQIVLLDEPTNGMDPEMRRRVWDNILKLIKDDRSVLLTSHSMAECDALCSRLAIMVNGQFMCLGTTQHLKHRFGGGYTLQIKVLRDTALPQIIEFIEHRFLNSILKDKHGNKLEFIIPHRGNSLGKIFGVLEANKEKFQISDYSVSQTTLDQVFINFAKSQRDVQANDEEDLEAEQEDGKTDDLNKTHTSEELKYNAEITMINRKTSSKKSSLRKTSNCSHISKIAARCESDSLDSTGSSHSSGCVNPAFEVEPPIMYSNNNNNNTDAIIKIEPAVKSVSNLNDSIDYEYYSKC